jgi:hypothetical protein
LLYCCNLIRNARGGSFFPQPIRNASRTVFRSAGLRLEIAQEHLDAALFAGAGD